MQQILGKLYMGDDMKTNKEILTSIVKTTQMGQTGIRSVMPYAGAVDLKKALNSQKREYDIIEQEAFSIASARGWELKELDPMSKLFSNICAHGTLMFGNADSKIAAMMINGNTRGMIKGLKNTHHGENSDHAINMLSQKLLDCESENIRQMQGYV